MRNGGAANKWKCKFPGWSFSIPACLSCCLSVTRWNTTQEIKDFIPNTKSLNLCGFLVVLGSGSNGYFSPAANTGLSWQGCQGQLWHCRQHDVTFCPCSLFATEVCFLEIFTPWYCDMSMLKLNQRKVPAVEKRRIINNTDVNGADMIKCSLLCINRVPSPRVHMALCQKASLVLTSITEQFPGSDHI